MDDRKGDEGGEGGEEEGVGLYFDVLSAECGEGLAVSETASMGEVQLYSTVCARIRYRSASSDAV